MNGDPLVRNHNPVPESLLINSAKSASDIKGLLAIPALLLLDLMAIILALAVAYLARIYILPLILPNLFKPELLATTIENIWWLPIIIICCMAYEELYQKRLPFWKEVEKILKACTLAVIFSISMLYLTKISDEMSRTLVVIAWLTIIVLLPFVRYIGKVLLVKTGIWQKPVLIIGAGKTGELILKALTRENTMGYQVIGVLDDNKELKGLAIPGSERTVPILGTFDDAEQVIASTKVQEVIIAAPGLQAKQLVELTNRLQPMVNNVMLVPDLFGLSMNGIEVEYFFDEQALLLNIKNKLKSPFNRAVKRAFDIVAGSFLMAVCLPIIIVISIAIRIDSPGAALFSQTRIGQRQNNFTCFKFRTMYIDGDKLLKKHLKKNESAKEEWESFNKLRGRDPRVTRLGYFLRRFSLDELPQLINVINGEMSLVGPRPYLPREREQIGHWIHDIQVAKPGITGLWQVSGRNQIDFEGRLKLDAWYVRNWSVWLDIVLLIKTIRVVLKREGAY